MADRASTQYPEVYVLYLSLHPGGGWEAGRGDDWPLGVTVQEARGRYNYTRCAGCSAPTVSVAAGSLRPFVSLELAGDTCLVVGYCERHAYAVSEWLRYAFVHPRSFAHRSTMEAEE